MPETPHCPYTTYSPQSLPINHISSIIIARLNDKYVGHGVTIFIEIPHVSQFV
jgi:hypothetical protein